MPLMSDLKQKKKLAFDCIFFNVLCEELELLIKHFCGTLKYHGVLLLKSVRLS